MSVHIISDSGCDLSKELCAEHNISFVPLSVRFADREYIDREDIDPQEFYDLMSKNAHLPESAAPSPGQFLTVFEELKAKGATDIIHVALSSKLSATGQSARTAAESIDGVNIHVFDSLAVSSSQGTLVLKAAEAAARGDSAQEILALLEDLRDRSVIYGALDTLENLKKGGRISNVQAMVGSVLSVKPIINLQDGSVVQVAKPRTRKKSLGWIVAQVPEDATDFAISHALAPDVDVLVGMLGKPVDRIGEMGPVVGVHGGSRCVTLSFLLPEGQKAAQS